MKEKSKLVGYVMKKTTSLDQMGDNLISFFTLAVEESTTNQTATAFVGLKLIYQMLLLQKQCFVFLLNCNLF